MRLGEVLVDLGHATALQVEMALALQRDMGGQIGAILMAIGAITGEQLRDALRVQREAVAVGD
ncbi:MAG TPA: hypothetical protein VG651_19040 [Stellaceae bacterium]|nr:hypothetical protein [Stellaceae bacterium]